MKLSTSLFLGFYKFSLHLYPQAFRQRYAEQLIDAARLQQSESTNDLQLAASLLWDALRSALREQIRAASPASPAYVAAFALFFSVLLLAVAVITQQYLRRSADSWPTFFARLASTPMDERSEPYRKIMVAHDLAGPKQEISSSDWLNSTSIFTVLYDASGHALTGNATLHGALPQPPPGIFNVIQQRGEDKVTWQPQPGIRVALTGRPMPNGGFVLAGQSLLPSEARTASFYSLLRWIWAFAMLACCSLALFARKHTRNLTT